MKKENIIKHINNSREINKAHILGPYIGSFSLLYLGGFLAYIEYRQTIITILLLILMIISVVYSSNALNKDPDNLYYKSITMGLSILFLIIGFNYLFIQYVDIELVEVIGIKGYHFVIGELFASFLMPGILFSVMKNGRKPLMQAIIGFSGTVAIMVLLLGLNDTISWSQVSDDIGLATVIVMLGSLTYPIYDNFIRAYYIKKFNITIEEIKTAE